MLSASLGNQRPLTFKRNHPGTMVTFCVCVRLLAEVIFNWLRSAGVRNSYTLQPCGGPSVKSWTLYAEGCRTGPQPTSRICVSVHVSPMPVSAVLYRSVVAPCPVFTLCLYKGSKSHLLLSNRKLFLAAAHYRGFPSCFSRLRWWAKQFHAMMDAPFTKLVAVSQLLL